MQSDGSCLLNLGDKDTGILPSVGEDIDSIDISGAGGAQKSGQSTHFIRVSPTSCRYQLQLIFGSFRLIIDRDRRLLFCSLK